jgi:hypothetical protein
MTTVTKKQAQAAINQLRNDPNFVKALHGDPGSIAGKDAREKWSAAHQSLANAAPDPVSSAEAARAAIAEKGADTAFTKRLFEGDGEARKTWAELHKQAVS